MSARGQSRDADPDRSAPASGAVLPAAGVFLVSGTVQYLGAALAVGLFAVLPATSVAWWRMSVAALLLLAWRRPWRHRLSRRELVGSALFGVVLATMNVLFYGAIERIPLGAAVSLEFLGPVVVAALGATGVRSRVALVLATAGVLLIGGLGVDPMDPDQRAGILLALAAGAAWAGYIVLGRRIAAARSGLDSLAIGLAAGSIAYVPLAWPGAAGAFDSLGVLAAVIGVAVFSSMVPYSLEQVVLSRVSAATFALLTALLPATSMAVGAFALRQMPSWAELAGTAAISVAIVLTAWRGRVPRMAAARGRPRGRRSGR